MAAGSFKSKTKFWQEMSDLHEKLKSPSQGLAKWLSQQELSPGNALGGPMGPLIAAEGHV